MSGKTSVMLVCILAAAGISHAQDVQDRVKIQNAGGEEKGVLIDGTLSILDVNDATFTSPDVGSFFSALFPSVVLDNFTLSAQSNEVIAFVGGHPPAVKENVVWSAGSDTVDLGFSDEYRIPVSVWIVFGPFAQQRGLAVDHSIETARIWREERQGLAFSSVEINDATNAPGALGLTAVDCSDVSALAAVGFKPDRVNVYYVDAVIMDKMPTRFAAWWCGLSSQTIIMSSRTSGALFAHELGHAFDLGHVDDFTPFFDTTNVMHSFSPDRRGLTEGQTFRAVFGPFSVLNALYDVRQFEITRFCPGSVTPDDACPVLQKRIWNDGVWPPN